MLRGSLLLPYRHLPTNPRHGDGHERKLHVGGLLTASISSIQEYFFYYILVLVTI